MKKLQLIAIFIFILLNLKGQENSNNCHNLALVILSKLNSYSKSESNMGKADSRIDSIGIKQLLTQYSNMGCMLLSNSDGAYGLTGDQLESQLRNLLNIKDALKKHVILSREIESIEIAYNQVSLYFEAQEISESLFDLSLIFREAKQKRFGDAECLINSLLIERYNTTGDKAIEQLKQLKQSELDRKKEIEEVMKKYNINPKESNKNW